MPTGIYPRTNYHRKQISKALSGKPKLWQRGKLSNFKGKKHTKKSKLKISKASLGRTPWNKGLTKKTDKRVAEMSGENHYNWGGGCVNSRGYKRIYKPKHPLSDVDGYIREHRVVMEKKLGRYLKPEEVVHHIDHNKRNNDQDNLMLFASQSKHIKYERSELCQV